ncbi:alpha/beta fold hydrolase [Prescottella agglutinans]|uniref:3-oxoadipate enol-lactonase n=1 Tax=Prescottella agglutinans TaxID=1644129 RepID=A0ABT6MK04_9NOCA|nr:alpha/beta hydrolase [Prescottella agglutinans]MDH6284657.1 3-oxoadipate enol-lactonase [Prescottella agglutinans]
MPYVETDAGSVYYEDSGGDGPAIILSHGFLMDHRMFDPQVEALSDYRWIRWDTRHHGQSRTAAAAYSYWDQARDGLAILDEVGIETAVFGGHSQGGYIALRMALLSPKMCDGLMLFGTAARAYTDQERAGYRRVFSEWIKGPTHPAFEPIALTLATTMIGGDREQQRPWSARWLERDWSDFGPAVDCLIDHDSVEALVGELTCPAVIVRGAADQAFSDRDVQELASQLGGEAEVHTVDQTTHAANLTDPELVNPLLRKWLGQLSIGTPTHT